MSDAAEPSLPGSARDAVLRILEELELPPDFPPEVEAEVAALLRDNGLDDPTLVDLTALPFVTIDGPDSRDLDQALFLEHAPPDAPDGARFLVHYAIADASFYVRPGSAIFREALRRGSSYYVPGRVVPMLHPALSEGIVSLNPDGPRRAVVFTSRLDARGACLATTLRRARVLSHAKLAFPQVQRFLDGLDPDLDGRPFSPSLRLLPVVGKLRMDDQELRQVVRYRRIEVEIYLSHGRDALMAVVASRGEVERYNEQLSLLCNSEGGRLLSQDDLGPAVQGIYRAHPAPPASRMAEFEALLEGLAARHGLGDEWRWRRDSDRGLSEFLAALPESGPRWRVAVAIQRLAVTTNLRSSYTEAPATHHGVGASPYARFSAPMREIVGIFVHKELMEKLGYQPSLPEEQDELLRQEVIASASRARELQGTLDARINRLVIDRLLASDLARPRGERPSRSASVLGVSATKVHVRLDDPPLEIKLYRTDLEAFLGGRLRLSADGVALEDESGFTRLLVGAPIWIRVERVDEARDRWILELLPPAPSPSEAAALPPE
ncbi:MAG: RNB domain-containing ribonuclease [Polyangiaceae bacterium]|jgi:ribonuclease R|nr:RNB domain-containing ribonuclease [Polyangiaceae bacterium]